MKQYEQDIAYIYRLIDEYEVIQKYLVRRKKDRPNYWYILYHQKSDQDKVHYERSYSKVLAWLLNPHENHRLGHRFAEYLLAELAGGQKFHLEESEEAMAQTEKAHIDVFYANPASKQVIAIEVKQYSDETSLEDNPKLSQLDRYNKYLEENYAVNGYHLNRIFLTPMGDKSKSETAAKIWHPMSYERLIQILEKLLLDAPRYTAKIIEDFIHDLERTVIVVDKGDLSEKIKKEEGLDWDSIDRLWKLYQSDDESMIEKRKSLNKKLTDDVIETLFFLRELRRTQNHDRNPKVQYLIRRVFNLYAKKPIHIGGPEDFGKESKDDRESELNEDGKQLFPDYETIRISGSKNDKGQGIFIEKKVSHEKYDRVAIYFSGDTYGDIFNSGIQKIFYQGSNQLRTRRIPKVKKEKVNNFISGTKDDLKFKEEEFIDVFKKQISKLEKVEYD